MTTLNQAVKTFNQREATRAALQNEMVTRQRVARLEWVVGNGMKDGDAIRTGGLVDRVDRTDTRLGRVEMLLSRGFGGRLRWLLTGR